MKPPGAVCARSGLAAPTTIDNAIATRTAAQTIRGNPRNTTLLLRPTTRDLPRRRCGKPAGRTEERQKAPAARAPTSAVLLLTTSPPHERQRDRAIEKKLRLGWRRLRATVGQVKGRARR